MVRILWRFVFGVKRKSSGMLSGIPFSAALSVLTFFLVLGCSTEGPAPISVSKVTPTTLRFDGDPVPTLIPTTNLYLFLNSDRPLYFSDGQYFQSYKGHWFSSNGLEGPWMPCEVMDLPDLLRSVPPEYYYDNFPSQLKKDR
ncbi:MAG: hypothetical protein ACYCXP_12645 [Leptospirillum sp.]|nr:hypothetical protein [Nitrospiraceae bacterium]